MREQIRSLWELQQLDLEIANLKSRNESIPQEIQEGKEKLNIKEEELSKYRKKYDELYARRRMLEQDIEESKDRIRRYKSQLLLVKTNKEYQSLLHEINTEEAKISAYEEECLELFSDIDELSKEINKLSDKLVKSKEKFELYKNKLEKEHARVIKELEIKERERAELAGRVDKIFLARYEQIRRGRNGIGVVEISESTCTGCNAVIPPQFIAEIKKGDKILTCEQCGRLLVWKENVV